MWDLSKAVKKVLLGIDEEAEAKAELARARERAKRAAEGVPRHGPPPAAGVADAVVVTVQARLDSMRASVRDVMRELAVGTTDTAVSVVRAARFTGKVIDAEAAAGVVQRISREEAVLFDVEVSVRDALADAPGVTLDGLAEMLVKMPWARRFGPDVEDIRIRSDWGGVHRPYVTVSGRLLTPPTTEVSHPLGPEPSAPPAPVAESWEPDWAPWPAGPVFDEAANCFYPPLI